MPTPPTILTIDLGTTTVVAARSDDGGTADVVVNTPAVVAVDGEQIVTGTVAQAIATAHPDSAAGQIMRRFGDASPVILDGHAFGVGQLVGAMIDDVVRVTGTDPATTRLVLTHPAAWRDHRVELLRSLGTERGFASVDTMAEAIAATSATDRGAVLVVDVGGGTVEASVVQVESGSGTLVATQLLERLGGNDFDQAVFTHVSDAVDGMIGALDRRDPAVRQSILALRTNCTEAKERLSAEADATIAVDAPGLHTAVRLTRPEFESMIRPQVDAIVALADRVVTGAGLSVDGLDRIALTGGSTTVPLVGEMLAGHFGRAAAAGSDPAASVALGAAVRAAASPDETTPDVTAHERQQPMNDERPTNADTPTEAGAAAGTPAPTTPGQTTDGTAKRTAPPPPPSAEKREASGAAKVGVGVAAAAAAAGAAVVFGDDIAAALEGDDGTPTATDEPATIDADPDGGVDDEMDVEMDGGMDEFDAVAPAAGPVGVPLDADSSGGGDTGAAGPAAFRSAPAAPHQDPGRHESGRQAPTRHQVDDDGPGPSAFRSPPTPADTAAGAAPTHPPAGSPAPQAASAPPVDTPVRAAPVDQPAGPTTGPMADAAFEQARATLLERLENFVPPGGATPEEAAELRQELADAVARFQPRPGESTDAAMRAMRDDFDRRVQDFVQDQKIDALVDEVERDNASEAAAAATAAGAEAADPDGILIGLDDPADTAGPDADQPDVAVLADDEGAVQSETFVLVQEDASASVLAPDAPIVLDVFDELAVDIEAGLSDIATAAGDDVAMADETMDAVVDQFTDASAGLLGEPVADAPVEFVPVGVEVEAELAPIEPPAPLTLDDDVLGSVVFDDVIQVPLDVVPLDGAVPDPVADPVTIDADVVDTLDDSLITTARAELPPDFEPPVYVEPEPVFAEIAEPAADEIVEFGVQGLEEEGDNTVLDAPADLDGMGG